MLGDMAQSHRQAENSDQRPILDRFGRALRKLFAELDKPEPERWGDLLERLNTEESVKRSHKQNDGGALPTGRRRSR